MSDRVRLVPIVLGAVALVAVALVAPAAALAGNGVHPRTPVVWNDVECRTMMDRSSGPVFHLDYDIPFEDTEITVDEVADSRRHEFVAFCEDNSPQDFLPNWITWADVEAAAAKGLVDMATIADEQVLETSRRWEGCWIRINGDDRLPITMESAAAGVDWDTTGAPVGGYFIHGYTWEPPFNVWVQRPGFVKVIDGDPNAAPPAIAVTNGELVLYKDGMGLIEGCTDAMEGSTLTAYWSIAQDEPEWTSFVEDEPVAGSGFALELVAPEGLAGESGMVRVDVTDPMGRTTEAYGIELVIVLPTNDPGSCGDGGGFVAEPGCADTGDVDTAGDESGVASGDGGLDAGTGSAGTTGPMADGGNDDAADGGGGSSCACVTTPGPRGSFAMLVLVGLGLVARRRHARGRVRLCSRTCA